MSYGSDDDFDLKLRQRGERLSGTSEGSHFQKLNGHETINDALDMHPVGPSQPHGSLPNTPGAVSLISFLLGGLCFLSLKVFFSKLQYLNSNLDDDTQAGWWWSTPQLGFFLGAWSFFHWAEFSVTAGWNREKCSIDCEY